MNSQCLPLSPDGLGVAFGARKHETGKLRRAWRRHQWAPPRRSTGRRPAGRCHPPGRNLSRWIGVNFNGKTINNRKHNPPKPNRNTLFNGENVFCVSRQGLRSKYRKVSGTLYEVLQRSGMFCFRPLISNPTAQISSRGETPT